MHQTMLFMGRWLIRLPLRRVSLRGDIGLPAVRAKISDTIALSRGQYYIPHHD
jgi:hypothetical protein